LFVPDKTPTMKAILSVLIVLFSFTAFGQNKGTVTGKIIDETTSEPIPFANVVIEGTQIGSSSDIDGNFTITNVPYGYSKLVASAVGFETTISEDVYVTASKSPYIEVKMRSTSTELKEFVVETSAFQKTEESPVSVQTLGVEEIERNPGGNRDISRVIQSLPGVASTPSFRNDIIIRGGAPNENRFYIDDVETPVINHFQTQGSSGGPVGMLNVNLVKEVNLYTSAFPAARGNALSSVLEFRQLDGNKERLNLRGTIGSSDLALAVDGPVGEKTTFIVSARRSYLQFLFDVLGLPFLPTYNDMQFKVKHKFNNKNELSFIGLGAYDQFDLNESVNDDVDDEDDLERNNYILGNIPVNEQWNYTLGAVYKHYGKKSFQTYVLSRNTLNNSAYKYEDNDENLPKILDYESEETENKFRFENTYRDKGYRINAGMNLEHAYYTNATFNRLGTPAGVQIINYNTELNMLKYGAFGSISKDFFNTRLNLTLGVRFDGNDYNDDMSNALNQFSPRLAGSYALTEKWSLNFNVGRYYQLPAYTVLGFSDANGELLNQDRTKYIQSDHLVGGVEFQPDLKTKITVEGFLKQYDNYPFSLRDSISLANLGADFGVVGNEETSSIGKGRSYGVEFLIQRRSTNGIYGIMAYTWVRSEFEDKDGEQIASAWDSRHIFTFTGGKKFKGNWELGIRWRYVGGLPFTPYDVPASSLQANWDVNGRGILDYDQLNSQRLADFQQLDVRVDKIWYFEKWTLNLYLDIQNLYNFQSEEPDILNMESDANGDFITDPNDPTRYVPYFINNTSGTVLPTIGVIIDL
jgi:hypothetical protein